MAKSRTHMIDPASKSILYILLDGKKRVSTPLAKELEKNIGMAFTSIAKRYDPLIESGLVIAEEEGVSIFLSITEKGKKVAEKLKEIDKIMEG